VLWSANKISNVFFPNSNIRLHLKFSSNFVGGVLFFMFAAVAHKATKLDQAGSPALDMLI
jgi:hypothetical protein